MMSETPTISNAAYSSNTLTGMMWGQDQTSAPWVQRLVQEDPIQYIQQHKPQPIMPNTTRRIVQVFIADTNENVPLESSVLYTGPQKLTDATDTELFFEIPINDLLKEHNTKRVTWLDKEATRKAGKDILLEAIKIRDLKMVVVDIAKFS